MVAIISREEFKKKLDDGRKMVWASLYERQDFIVQLTPTLRRPARDVTREPEQWSREFIGSK